MTNKPLKEDAPANCVGTGNIAGTTSDTVGVPKGKTSTIIKRTKGVPMNNVFKQLYNKLKEDDSLTEAVAPQQNVPPEASQQVDPQGGMDKNSISNAMASEFFARARALSTVTHFAHLSTDSYSEHQALSTFYTDIIGTIDSFCEAYIGLYGKFITLPQIPSVPQLAVDAIMEMRDWIGQNRSLISDDSSLQNIIDESVELINTTIYKLQKLK